MHFPEIMLVTGDENLQAMRDYSEVLATIFFLVAQFYIPHCDNVHNRYTWLKPRSAMLSYAGFPNT
jgi:hypothetical protein